MQNDIPKILELWAASPEKSIISIPKTRSLEMNNEVLLYLIRE